MKLIVICFYYTIIRLWYSWFEVNRSGFKRQSTRLLLDPLKIAKEREKEMVLIDSQPNFGLNPYKGLKGKGLPQLPVASYHC